ncbi:hypothetical protein GIB67_015473 [Kingdonia uniflora]|uniref:Uncharacterized protein n=1 Tax=Kingdonia uniflora TaxID=39325 RepID=A0A7J7LA31_9MAGN|nr:hypothetical protein GIB67_015473 [Kingdonia uniflora]
MAGMISIIDEVKNRIQKLQSIGQKREAELRRCYTDLKSNPVPREKKTPEALTDENEKLQKELNASVAARKSLERMFSSLGKEKEIMATELSRKVQELTGIEEHLNDLKAQNELLLGKVQTCAAEHKGNIHSNRGDAQGNTTLQERNKTLSEQLLKSLDRYRSLKRKLKEAQQEKADIQAKIGILTGETQQEKTRIPLNDPKRSEFTKSTPDLKAGKAFVLA